jgi:hypothetical protein
VSQFEYVVVLISVIAGLGIVHLLRGVASFFTAPDLYKPYWVHLLWTWNVFQFIVFFWWFVWRWSAVSEWQLLLFFFVLIYAICLYLLCAVLYPTDHRGKVDFRTVYMDNRRVFYLLLVITMLVDIVDTRWKLSVGLTALGIMHTVIWVTVIVGSLIGAKVKNHIYHAVWGFIFFALMSYIQLAQFSVLRAD